MKKQSLASAATEKTVAYDSTISFEGKLLQTVEETNPGIKGRVQNQLRNMTDYFHAASKPRLKYAGKKPMVNLEKQAKKAQRRTK